MYFICDLCGVKYACACGNHEDAALLLEVKSKHQFSQPAQGFENIQPRQLANCIREGIFSWCKLHLEIFCCCFNQIKILLTSAEEKRSGQRREKKRERSWRLFLRPVRPESGYGLDTEERLFYVPPDYKHTQKCTQGDMDKCKLLIFNWFRLQHDQKKEHAVCFMNQLHLEIR